MKTYDEFTASVLEKAEAERKRRSANKRRLIIAVPGAAAAVAAVVFAVVVFRSAVTNPREIAVDTTAPSFVSTQSAVADGNRQSRSDLTVTENTSVRKDAAVPRTEKATSVRRDETAVKTASPTSPSEPAAAPYEPETASANPSVQTVIPYEPYNTMHPTTQMAPTLAPADNPVTGYHDETEKTTTTTTTDSLHPVYTTSDPQEPKEGADGPTGAEEPVSLPEYKCSVISGVRYLVNADWIETDYELGYTLLSEEQADIFNARKLPLTTFGETTGYFFSMIGDDNTRYFMPDAAFRIDGMRVIFTGGGSAESFLAKVNDFVINEKGEN
ncbi:MAG: hypothetical protein K6G90_04005 [Clostridia bacterium]|nr:hypothetical protein [Clostridia bacterium]